ncbi:MAG: YlbF family regulator [Anaerolineaceae bacterium]|nr:YlbF family regulator [Anaerolineaceae bacterium]
METATLPTILLQATTTLAENLLQSEPFLQYHSSYKKLEEDSKASLLLQNLSKTQAELRRKQSQSKISEEELNHLRVLQQQAQSNKVILEYAEAQQAAIEYLKEINQEISNLIGIDFGSLARRSGCC